MTKDRVGESGHGTPIEKKKMNDQGGEVDHEIEVEVWNISGHGNPIKKDENR